MVQNLIFDTRLFLHAYCMEGNVTDQGHELYSLLDKALSKFVRWSNVRAEVQYFGTSSNFQSHYIQELYIGYGIEGIRRKEVGAAKEFVKWLNLLDTQFFNRTGEHFKCFVKFQQNDEVVEYVSVVSDAINAYRAGGDASNFNVTPTDDGNIVVTRKDLGL